MSYEAELRQQLQELGKGLSQAQAAASAVWTLSSHGEAASLGRLREMVDLGPFPCQQDPLSKQASPGNKLGRRR